jgi:hypothetical protein
MIQPSTSSLLLQRCSAPRWFPREPPLIGFALPRRRHPLFASTPVRAKALPSAAQRHAGRSRAVLVVSHHLDGLLRKQVVGLLHPTASQRFVPFPPDPDPVDHRSDLPGTDPQISRDAASHPSKNSPCQQPFRVTTAVALLRFYSIHTTFRALSAASRARRPRSVNTASRLSPPDRSRMAHRVRRSRPLARTKVRSRSRPRLLPKESTRPPLLSKVRGSVLPHPHSEELALGCSASHSEELDLLHSGSTHDPKVMSVSRTSPERVVPSSDSSPTLPTRVVPAKLFCRLPSTRRSRCPFRRPAQVAPTLPKWCRSCFPLSRSCTGAAFRLAPFRRAGRPRGSHPATFLAAPSHTPKRAFQSPHRISQSVPHNRNRASHQVMTKVLTQNQAGVPGVPRLFRHLFPDVRTRAPPGRVANFKALLRQQVRNAAQSLPS